MTWYVLHVVYGVVEYIYKVYTLDGQHIQGCRLS